MLFQQHPGGTKIILKYAGKDATDAFNATHPPGVIDAHLPKDKHLGPIASQDAVQRSERTKTKDELRMEREQRNKPSISKMHNLSDLEVGDTSQFFSAFFIQCIFLQNVARKVLSYKALAYYSSATDDEICKFFFHTSLSKI